MIWNNELNLDKMKQILAIFLLTTIFLGCNTSKKNENYFNADVIIYGGILKPVCLLQADFQGLNNLRFVFQYDRQ